MAQRIMNIVSKKPTSSDGMSPETQQDKVDEVRKQIGSQSRNLSLHCTDASISRYLRTVNWNVSKAVKMLKASLKWRLGYKPDEICWDDIAEEAKMGRMYLASYKDKYGRPVLVIRPRYQSLKSVKEQVKYLVYCLEKAISDLNLTLDQEEIVWLIDFHGFSLANVSLAAAREVINVVQDHYPQRIGVALLCNPPKVFEPFWKLVKTFCDQKTVERVKFVYLEDPTATKIIDELFEIEKEALESAFGGRNCEEFDINMYAERMRDYDRRAGNNLSKVEEDAAADPTELPPPPLLLPITAA